MQEETNIEEQDIFNLYGYKENQEILINAEFLIGVLSFCRRVDEQQPPVAVFTKIPKGVNKINDKRTGELTRVDYDWENFPTRQSFANTMFNKESAVPILTQLGVFSFQIQSKLYDLHQANIINGIAIKHKENATA